MSLWISCRHGGELSMGIVSTSHDAVHDALEETFERLGRQGLKVRNVLRDGEPAWDVLDAGGAVRATYWISRGDAQRC